jgi:hypothetical protein
VGLLTRDQSTPPAAAAARTQTVQNLPGSSLRREKKPSEDFDVYVEDPY